MKINPSIPLDLRSGSDQEFALTSEETPPPDWAPFLERFRHVWRIMPASVQKAVRTIVNERIAQNYEQPARRVLEFMNNKRPPHKRGFKPVEANLRLIRARFVEGYSEDELRAVVALKWRQVEAGEFPERYFRPETLFRATKCAQYAGELGGGR